jgi:hypothetical protein
LKYDYFKGVGQANKMWYFYDSLKSFIGVGFENEKNFRIHLIESLQLIHEEAEDQAGKVICFKSFN